MAESADARRIVTLTFQQPHAVDPGSGLPLFPAGFEQCSWDDHVYAYSDGTLRWRVLPTCGHCLRRVSSMLVRWRKRLRRRWPGFQYLRVYETHKSGALHIHVLAAGLPRTMVRASRSAREVKWAWAELGGGFVDIGRDNRNGDGHRQAGGYAAKYLTKAASRPIRRGFRVWSRSRGFGPDVTMPGHAHRDPDEPPPLLVLWQGWLDPWSGEVSWRRPSPQLQGPPLLT